MTIHCFFRCFILPLLLVVAGCAGPQIAEQPDRYSLEDPLRKEAADVAVSLLGSVRQGEDGTLVEDPGWREYFLEIENLGSTGFTVNTVKLLNNQGRYVDSAGNYEQIIAPPNTSVELAEDVAGTAAGIAAGQVIPFGGSILGVLQGAVSAKSAETRIRNKRIFGLRVLKNVELGPSGVVIGSAFLPDVSEPQTLVVDFSREGDTHRITLPLSNPKK